jgi:putative inorganic carbon (HCO3(-)) transporter
MDELRRLSASVQYVALFLLFLLLPFSNAVAEISSSLLILGWLCDRCNPRTRWQTLWLRPQVRPVIWALAGCVGVFAFSVLVSTDQALSLNGLVNKWLEYLLLFMAVADLGVRPGVAERCGMLMAWSTLLVAFEGITQELTGRGLLRGYSWIVYERMTGPYKNPIDLGTYLLVAIPILIALTGHVRSVPRVGVWGVVGVAAGCLIRTEAQSAWIGFVIALGCGFWLSRWLRGPFMVFLMLGIGLGAAILVPTGGMHTVTRWVDRGMQDRWFMWQAAWGMIRTRPLVGHGLNTFMANYLRYWVGGEQQPRYAHNCYLQMWAETGLIGLVAFVWLLAQMGLYLFREVRRTADGPLRALLAALIAGLVGFLAQAGIDTNFYSLRHAVLFWMLAGLALGLAERIRMSSSHESSAVREPGSASPAAIVEAQLT